MSLESKILKLEKKSLAQGQYPLAAAAAHLLADATDINRQINLVGALHEVGLLQNSLSPYWKEFRTNELPWVESCISRLVSTDHDYWALAALLGCNGPKVIEAALRVGFKSADLRSYERYDKPDVHMSMLYLNSTGKVLRPILEIGYDLASLVTVDVGRARALCLDDEDWKPNEPIRTGWLSLSMQAKLPHGAWRSVNTQLCS